MKKTIKAIPYMSFGVVTIYSVAHGFSWLFWVIAALTCILLVLDILEVISNGRR
jgi:hypothetical protein